MLYSSFGPTKLRPRQALLKFCELVLEAAPTALHAKTLQEDLNNRGNEEFESSMKFGKFMERVRFSVVLSYCKALSRHQAEKHDTSLTTILPHKEIKLIEMKRLGGPHKNRLGCFHILYPATEKYGICLTVHRTRDSYFSIRAPKLSLVQKLATAAGLPEPTAIHDWPQVASSIAPAPVIKTVVVNVPSPLVPANGVNIPFADLLDFLRQYKTAGTNSF